MRLIDADALTTEKNIYEADLRLMIPLHIIEDAPTIEAEPVRYGRWMLHDNGSGTCDQCHFTQKNVWDDDGWQNYCGVCGAKMDGGDAG